MKAEELGYLAGLIDGEGTVIFTASRGYADAVGTVRISVASTHAGVMRWLKQSCGGSTRERPAWTKRGDQSRIGLKPCFVWEVSGERAAIILRAVHPMLIIKRDETAAALARWEESYVHMRRPRTRDFYRRKVQAEMRELGWIEADPSRMAA